MDDCQNINAPAAESPVSSAEDSSLVQNITQSIVELNTCLKIVQMYPPKHVQVQRSLKQARDTLNQVLSAQPELVIGIAKNTLLIGGKPLDPKNTICQNFATTLMGLEVAAIMLLSGVSSEELLRFLLLIAEKPDEIHAKGGIQKAGADCRLSNIQIQAIDYGKFQFTEEAEITEAHKTADHGAKPDVWHNYIVHLISGTLTESESGKSLSEFGDVDPIKIAEMLNQNRIDLNAVLHTYEDVLRDQADRLRAAHSAGPPADRAAEDPNPANFPDASVGNLQNLNLLLQELNPEIRRQFLAVTFQQCNTEDAATWADEFLGNFSKDLVVDMLRQENKNGREISPSLVPFIQKFSGSGLAAPPGTDSEGDPNAPHISAEHLQAILQPEAEEDSVDSEYDPLVQKLAGKKQPEMPAAKERLPLDKILEELEDSQLATKVGMLLLSFMKKESSPEKYKAYGAKLLDVANELLEAGHISLLKNIMIAISQQSREQNANNNQTAAQELILSWQSPAFTSKAVQTILGAQDRMDAQGYDFLRALGPRIVPDLVNFYGKQKNPENHEALFKLLTEFKAEAAAEAQKRLRDTRPEYVRNMVTFIRRIKAQKAVPRLRALMDKSNTRVQMEVLVALLEFNDGWAAYHLRKLLQSDRSDIASRSLAMAAKYKVREIVPDLLAMLKTRVMFKSDIQKNEQIISALGQIGDAAAIPALTKLAKSGGLFRQEEQLHMKQLLFASLQGYPKDAVGQLLKIGQKSKDKSIRNACRKITAGAN